MGSSPWAASKVSLNQCVGQTVLLFIRFLRFQRELSVFMGSDWLGIEEAVTVVGVSPLGPCSTPPTSPLQPQAKLDKPTGFGGTEEPMELAQWTNPQCSTHSESSAKVHPPETLMALFCKVPALHHSTGKRCVLDLPLARCRPAREQSQRPDIGYMQGC